MTVQEQENEMCQKWQGKLESRRVLVLELIENDSLTPLAKEMLIKETNIDEEIANIIFVDDGFIQILIKLLKKIIELLS